MALHKAYQWYSWGMGAASRVRPKIVSPQAVTCQAKRIDNLRYPLSATQQRYRRAPLITVSVVQCGVGRSGGYRYGQLFAPYRTSSSLIPQHRRPHPDGAGQTNYESGEENGQWHDETVVEWRLV